MKFKRFALVSLILGYTFLYTPILFLISFSFNSSQYPGKWTGFSLRWYAKLFEDSYLLDCVINSFKVATMAATLSVALGTIAAIVMVRFKPFRTKSFLHVLLLTPLAMPEVILGFSMLLVLTSIQNIFGIPSQCGLTTMVIAHTSLALGYVFMLVQARLIDFDVNLEEAALDLGATPLQAFFKITLPLIMPAIFSGWLLAFALSLDDVVVASFVSGAGSSTLPILIYSQIRMGITPVINALASLIILSVSLVIVLLSLGSRFLRR